MDVNQKKKLEAIVSEIDSIKQKLEGMKASLERIFEVEDIMDITVYQVRRAAILEEVYRADSVITSAQLSDIALKWGRNPQGTAGYFSGSNPSLRGIAGGKRALTERGQEIVMENRDLYGDDWIDKVDIEYVGNPNTPDDAIIAI